MKLYYSPGACSFASHLVLHELGLAHDAVRVNLRSKKAADGVDFPTLNPKGYVPALVLDDGTVLTEGTAILQYLADLRPESGLAPVAGTLARYRLLEWLGYLNSEVHKNYSPLFNPTATDEMKVQARAALARRLGFAADALAASPYLLGETFTVADAYLYTTLTWAAHVGVDLSAWPALEAYRDRIAARPAVQAAAAVEFPPR